MSNDPHAIVKTLARNGVVKIDGFLAPDALEAVRRELKAVRASLPEELQKIADEMFSGIESDTAPCGPYSLEGPAGTLIVFDERGMHRGGDISEGQRSILRISLRRENAKNLREATRAVIRKTARLLLPRRHARLM